MGTKHTRRATINRIREMVKQATEREADVSKAKLIAFFALEEAKTERSVKDLIETFIHAGEFVQDGDNIYYNFQNGNNTEE